MAVNLGESQIGVVIGVEVFDQFVKELFVGGFLPNEFSFEREVSGFGVSLVTIRLDVPDLVLGQRPAEEPRPELLVGGVIEVRPLGEPEAPPTVTVPLNVEVFLDFVLVPVEDEAPRLGIAYGGFAGPEGSIITPADVDELFTDPDITDTFAAVSIDIIGPAVEGAGPVLFPDESGRPAADGWSTGVTMLPATSSDEVDAIGVFLAAPGAAARPVVADSPLPVRTGFGLVYNRSFLDVAFGQAAAANVGEEIEGATIEELTLVMEDAAIFIDGVASRDSATITFVGPMVPSLVPGTIVLYQDTSMVEVDVDVPWWQDILLVFRFIPVFWPILIPAALIHADWNVWNGAAEIADAPDQVRSGLADRFAAQLVAFSNGLSVEAEVETVSLEATPDSSRIENGHFLLFAQTFVSVLVEPITNAYYSKRRKRFVQYELESGRLFKASELARLVSLNKIVTPGFHEVRRRWMRADPDAALSNNLAERFGVNLARPPY